MAISNIHTSDNVTSKSKSKLTFEQYSMMRSSVTKRKGKITVNTSLDGENAASKLSDDIEETANLNTFVLRKPKSKKYHYSTKKNGKKVNDLRTHAYSVKNKAKKASHEKTKKASHEKMVRYTTVRSDYGDEQAIISVDNAIEAAEIAGGLTKAAVSSPASIYKGVKTGAGKIQTGYARAKNAGKELATAVRTGNGLRYTKRIALNGAKATALGSVKTAVNIGKKGLSTAEEGILHQQIDKSITTDTGIEALKQGATYARYADNARKTGQNAIKTVKNIKNTPKNIKKAIEDTKKAAKVVGGLVKSKATIIVVLVAVVVNLISSVISGGLTTVVSAPASTFSWLYDDDVEEKEKKAIEKYVKIIKDDVADRQKEIDDVYDNFKCEKRQYGDKSEITELKTMYFNYRAINIKDNAKYSHILAIAATQWYYDNVVNGTDLPEDLKLKKSKIKDVISNYYNFEYSYYYDYCPTYSTRKYKYIMTEGNVHGSIWSDFAYYVDGSGFGCREIKEWVALKEEVYKPPYSPSNDDWDWGTIISGNRHFCNVKHKYLKGAVTNYSTPYVLDQLGFDTDQRTIYDMYQKQILEWLNEED